MKRIKILSALVFGVLISMGTLHAQRNPPSQAAIDVIKWLDSSGTLIKTFAGPFAIKCSTGVTCSVSGSTMTVTASGTGDVVGPASATDGAVALYDGTTGKLIKNGDLPITVTADLGIMDHTGATTFTAATKFRARATVGTGGVTQYKAVKLDTDGTVIAVAATTDVPIGVAEDTGIDTASVIIDQLGPATCLASGSVTAGRILTIDADGDAVDSGQTAYSAILSNVITLGWALEAGTAGNSFACYISPRFGTKNIGSFGASFSGGGSALTAGSTAGTQLVYTTVPYACTINGYAIVVDTGTISFDLWKVATGTAKPTISNQITNNTNFFELTTGTAVRSSNPTGLTTTAVAANDIVAIKIQTVGSSPTFANIVIECDR